MAEESGRLTARAIAQALFTLSPDRDERASQLCAEALLTLVQNDYAAPPSAEQLRSPKRQRWATRSLALRENFLAGRDSGHAGDDETRPAAFGALLASGGKVRDSSHLDLAQAALEGLVDPDTTKGQRGTHLLRPFHESLLWYDARPANPSRQWSVRKVYMRGSGITMARLLCSPPDDDSAALGAAAVQGLRRALTQPTALSGISDRLESALRGVEELNRPVKTEDDEVLAWEIGANPALSELAQAICSHAEGVLQQGGTSDPARLWQFRTVLALDLASHMLRCAWSTTDSPLADRYLLLSFAPGPRAEDVVRQRSEESLRRARFKLKDATINTLTARIEELVAAKVTDWKTEMGLRRTSESDRENDLPSQLALLGARPKRAEVVRVARAAFESGSYGRAEEACRVLLDSVGLIAGTGSYRYLSAGPDLLAAMVGALSARMPMTSDDFFTAIRDEWGFVINQQAAAGTSLSGTIDGALLERNARRAERLLNEAGLGVSLSDRTTVIGERARRSAS